MYGSILSIYYYYASASSDLDVYSIGPNEFNMLCVECDLAVPGSTDCAKQHLEQIFISVDAGQKTKEDFNKKHALSRQEFLQCVVRIAIHRYVKPRKRGEAPIHTDVADAIHELLKVHIEPRLDPAALQNSNDFRLQFVYTRETEEVLSDHYETLQVCTAALPVLPRICTMQTHAHLTIPRFCTSLHTTPCGLSLAFWLIRFEGLSALLPWLAPLGGTEPLRGLFSQGARHGGSHGRHQDAGHRRVA